MSSIWSIRDIFRENETECGYAAVQAEATLTTQRMQVYSRELILLKHIKHRWVKPKGDATLSYLMDRCL
jgi:hypothetical protein